MVRRKSMSSRTRLNWLLDFVVLMVGILAAISGIYFLFRPSGSYQGGRNPAYGVRGFIARETWDDIHTWGGFLMIVAAAVHFVYHWPWVVLMTKRMVRGLRGRGSRMSLGTKINVFVNVLLGASFFVTMISGVYFLFAPLRESRGMTNPAGGPGFGVTTWELIHTWSGIGLIITAVVHIALHWRWILNVTRRFFLSIISQVTRESRRGAKSV